MLDIRRIGAIKDGNKVVGNRTHNLAAYTKPICSSNSFFPTVHRRYTH